MIRETDDRARVAFANGYLVVQDMRESMFTETEPAHALREIRERYPAFDMVEFMKLLKGDVPVIIKAYLTGDLATLKSHCSKEMLERFSGIIAAQRAEVRPPSPLPKAILKPFLHLYKEKT